MAVPKRVLLLTAAAYAFFGARYAPGAAPFAAKSYGKNTVAVFALLYFVQLVWGILVYPLFLTPLRKLPTPKVSLILVSEREERLKGDVGMLKLVIPGVLLDQLDF